VNLAALTQAVRDRVDIDPARARRAVNFARADLDDLHLWPYRAATITGAAPLTVPDLGTVESIVDVTNGSNPLRLADRRDLEDAFSDLTTSGTPQYAYIDNGVIRTYPVGGSLSVRYYKVTTDLTLPADTPAAPSRFHRLIVDLAVERSLRDVGNLDGAEALRVAIERDLNGMRHALLIGHADGAASFIRTTGSWGY
jgi:hypothetical protein